MYLNEEVFNEQLRGLLVARGGYISEKKKEEIKRYWYLEFRHCDENAFVLTMEKLKFTGDGGFPTFRDFSEEYRQIIKPYDQDDSKEYCGFCHSGKVAYRDVLKGSDEVKDCIADCVDCVPSGSRSGQVVSPQSFHVDRLGVLRSKAALIRDREKIEIKRPDWISQRHPKLKSEKVYFQGLNPLNDPDVEIWEGKNGAS